MIHEQQNPEPAAGEAAHLERSRPGDEALGRSLSLVRYLREHCQWDARQTPESLRPYLLEEAHEVADAILSGDDDALARELGDLLLNVAFQTVLAEERGSFDAGSVARELERKMRDRHPHVYGDATEAPDWERLKATQRKASRPGNDAVPSEDPFDGLPARLEALSRALRMQDRAAGLNFDWPEVEGALAKLEEEVRELRLALDGGPGQEDATEVRTEEELGDVLFAAVNVARLAGVHPTTALERASARFAARFRRLLDIAREEGLDPRDASLEELDVLWERVKAESTAS